MKDDMDLEANTKLLIERVASILRIKIDHQSLLKDVAMKICPSELALDTFYNIIVNRSKVIEAIIKDLYDITWDKVDILNISFKTNEVSKNISEITSAFIFDRSVHIDGYKKIEIFEDELYKQCNL
jgi:hypothetical protein